MDVLNQKDMEETGSDWLDLLRNCIDSNNNIAIKLPAPSRTARRGPFASQKWTFVGNWREWKENSTSSKESSLSRSCGKWMSATFSQNSKMPATTGNFTVTVEKRRKATNEKGKWSLNTN